MVHFNVPGMDLQSEPLTSAISVIVSIYNVQNYITSNKMTYKQLDNAFFATFSCIIFSFSNFVYPKNPLFCCFPSFIVNFGLQKECSSGLTF